MSATGSPVRRPWRRWGVLIGGTLLAGYIGVCVAIYAVQDRLIYFPSHYAGTTPGDLGLDFEDLTLTTADGIAIHAWYIPRAEAGSAYQNPARQGLSLPTFSRSGGGANVGGGRRRRGLWMGRAEAQASGLGVMEDDVCLTTLAGPQVWAAQQFGQVALGDRRRTRRVVRLAAQMARHPAASLPAQTGVWHETKAG